MINNLNKFIYYTILLTSLVLLPFFGFSQQEEPKRVSITVIVKEINPTKEIVQVPATNLPLVTKISSRKIVKTTSSIRTSSIKKNGSPSYNSTKEIKDAKNQNAVAIKKKPTPQAPVSTPKPTPAKKVESIEKPTVTTTTIAKKNAEQKDRAVNAKATSPASSVSTNNDTIKTETNNTVTLKKAEKDTIEVLKKTIDPKANSSFSYIWIGIFLVIAGIVLGLLFGKPAFLVSFVGVVFIILGLVI